MIHTVKGDIKPNCRCGGYAHVNGNEIDDRVYQAKHHTVRFQVACADCHVATSFYPTAAESITAWSKKSWAHQQAVA